MALIDKAADGRLCLARSLENIEKQLASTEFSEPLSLEQVKRLSNIECILERYKAGYQKEKRKEEEPQEDYVFEYRDQIADIEHRIQPWVAKKNALIACLEGSGKGSELATSKVNVDKAEIHTGSKNNEDAADPHGGSLEKLDLGSSNSERKSDAFVKEYTTEKGEKLTPAKKRRGSLAAKREELLGEIEGLRHRGAVPESVDGVERLLNSQRAMHDDLTGDLVKMASILKKNTLAFGDLLEKDKSEIEETERYLEKSAVGVNKQGDRVGRYRKRAWGTTGLTWMMVLVVVSVFFMLVLFMRVAPKRY
ncbi:membrane fusion protein Use1-domain-containing protein [Coemansia spiralis]|nr:membrane fusion protein Use1-domain-containing protein [Coemansia spiralis]